MTHVLGDTSSDGVPLVLLHGFPLDHRMWLDAAAHVQGRPIHVPDLLGAAARARDLPEPSIEASADAVAAALDAAGVRAAAVAGLSMGGYVALALAERRPDLVAALALLDTKSTADTEEARANRLRIADAAESGATVDPVRPMAQTLVGPTTRETRPEKSEQIAAWIDEQDPAGVGWSQRAMAARPDRTHVLEAFTGPVLVLVGAEDDITPLAGAEHMAAAARDAVLVVVPGAGHMSALEQPAAVGAALEDLARRADARR